MIIVAIRDREKAGNTIRYFVEEKKIERVKIFDFFQLYEGSIPRLNIERVLYPAKEKAYEGVILGISHAYVDILTEHMRHPFLNLALTHQDLYYNMRSLEYMLEHYPEKIRNLRYAVIDMFDYTYFNYDVSLSENIKRYYVAGGFFLDAHNFSNNKRYTETFEELMEQVRKEWYGDITDNDRKVWDTYFPDIFETFEYELFAPFIFKNRNEFVTDEQIRNFGYGSVLYNVFPDTINENIKTFEHIFELLYQINKDMKIYTILLPRCQPIEEWEKQIPGMIQWKQIFYNMINDMKRKYQFEFIDFKQEESFKNQLLLFYDQAHFNYYGAMEFTKYLDQMLD